MDDRLRETLSAMMDDEADELSVRRLLSYGDQAEVREQWRRWQQIRDLIQDGHGPAADVDVSASVSGLLDAHGSDSPHPRSARLRRAWQWPVAAMVALVVGFGVGAGWESATPDVANRASPAMAGAPVSLPPEQELALQGLDPEQWELVSRYLLEHAQHNSAGAGRGSVGYARVVSASHSY